ncbi:MAG: helix-turn-helix domain-containing protein [Myxococcales bacterium]|nr:helix-turn-helix domain-containing protein [Myxococcales bacterium]
MAVSLTPEQAQELIAGGGLDVVDVRDGRDWAAGHVPGARSLPLDELRVATRAGLRGDRALFICARGVRSQTAAGLAESLGLRDVYSLDGGMLAWASAAMPIERAPEAEDASEAPDEPPPAAELAGCAMPEIELDTIVGRNLRDLRGARGLTLDTLARLTGLSRNLLGQLELGKTSPSVSLIWRLARAFDVPFSNLLATSAPGTINLLRASGAKRIVGGDGRFSSRALGTPSGPLGAEFYELYIAPHSREDAQAHQPGTRENLVVAAGRLELTVGAQRFELAKGDAIEFAADVVHAYENPGKDDCWLYLVMNYAKAT